MLALSFERRHAVLKLAFAGPFGDEDLDATDRAQLRFLGGPGRGVPGVRCLYDLTAVTELAVLRARFATRAQMPPLLPFGRVVVPFAAAPPEFGRSYREAQHLTVHAQPLIVPSLEAAYAHLGIVGHPNFEPVE